ncbi:MAG: hypothetical protein NT173_08985 [Opitutales bacterium]|nr:hypothetical protein [Opitutales bacterium]
MPSPKTYALLFLALTTAAGGGLAWRQYQELIRLRAAAANPAERADWQRRLWASEKLRHELEDALAAARSKGAEPRDDEHPDGPPAGADAGTDGPRRRGGPGGNLAANFMAMLDQPEVQKLMAAQQRGALDAHYADLFKRLNLPPDQLEKFKNLLVEKQTALADVLAAARAPQEFRKMVAATQAEIDASIRSTLGDPAYAQYQQYQQTQPQRNTVTQLTQALSYTSAPLTSAQAEQLVQVLASNSPASKAAANPRGALFSSFGAGLGAPGPSAPITDAAVAQAQSVLSAPQVQALQQLQQTQLAQQQLARAMRNQLGTPNSRAATPAATTVTPALPIVPPGG